MTEFTRRVIEIVNSIPYGKVASYGQIARLAGSPRAARQVVRLLHSTSKKYNLPWHRVVGKTGEIRLKEMESKELQKAYLQNEGVSFSSTFYVDMVKCGYFENDFKNHFNKPFQHPPE